MAAVPDLVGAERYRAILDRAGMTLGAVRVRAVLPPLPKPLKTASGQLDHAPVLLVDLETSAGVTGVSYLFSPRPDMLKPLMETVRAIAATVRSTPCDPVAVSARLDQYFLIFGGTGIVTMARAALDMAMWDTLAKQHGLPLFRLLGGSTSTVRAYESSGLGLSTAAEVAAEAAGYVRAGFDTMKLRLGYPDLAGDLEVVDAVRAAVGADVGLMVDYNQALTVEEALERCRALDDLGLLWIEEPVQAADLEGAALLAGEIATPIQIGENLFSPLEADRAIALHASDCLMPDVMKVGGVTNWLIAAHRAAGKGIPVSSHLFPEISAHLLACAPNRHFLEYANWVDAVLQTPLVPQAGRVSVPEAPGTGLAWDEAAVAKFGIGE